jgi:hypothetical protein
MRHAQKQKNIAVEMCLPSVEGALRTALLVRSIKCSATNESTILETEERTYKDLKILKRSRSFKKLQACFKIQTHPLVIFALNHPMFEGIIQFSPFWSHPKSMSSWFSSRAGRVHVSIEWLASICRPSARRQRGQTTEPELRWHPWPGASS